jgi:hypothetical protein
MRFRDLWILSAVVVVLGGLGGRPATVDAFKFHALESNSRYLPVSPS